MYKHTSKLKLYNCFHNLKIHLFHYFLNFLISKSRFLYLIIIFLTPCQPFIHFNFHF